jgi:hypothetical protein
VNAPFFDDPLDLLEAIEDFAIEQFIPEFALKDSQ